MTFKIKCGYEILSMMQNEITLIFKTGNNDIEYSVNDKLVQGQISPELDYSVAETFVSNSTAC